MRTVTQVSPAVRLPGARRERLCRSPREVVVTIASGKGADGQLASVLPRRPPSRTDRLPDDSQPGEEKAGGYAVDPKAALGAGRATIGVNLRTEIELRDFLIGETPTREPCAAPTSVPASSSP